MTGAALATTALLVLWSAAPPSTEADRLFAAGKQLLKSRPVEACGLFEKSFELEPALGTLLNLALCFELTDRLASAWLRFNESRQWAARTHETERELAAKEHAELLAPRLSWLAVAATPSVPGLEVEIGQQRIQVGATAFSVPVDPGTVRVRASAPGHLPWTIELQAPPAGQSTTLNIPPLEPIRPAKADAPVALRPAAAVLSSRVVEPSGSSRAPGAVLVASGAAIAAFGIVSLAYSLEVYSRAQAQRVDASSAMAPAVGRPEFDTARTLYPVSLVAMGVGIVTAGVGTWMLSRSPDSSPVSVGAVPLAGGAAIFAGASL
jgi:hypothetical protein